VSKAPETIYLIPGEYDGESEGEQGLMWCEDPAPGLDSYAADAIKYVRVDVHQEIIDRQAKVALMGMDAAKKHALSAQRNAERMLAESNPQKLESERAANAQLTQELERLQARVSELEHREDAMCDLHYANGAKQGFSWGQTSDEESLHQCVSARLFAGVNELVELRKAGDVQ
jgi:hypothetical protein